MTFEKFQSSRVACPDLSEAIGDSGLQGHSGFQYMDDWLYVEDTASWKTDRFPGKGRWYVVIGNQEYRSDDIDTVERKLYEFVLSC